MLSIPVPRISTTKQSIKAKADVFAKATSLRHIFASRAAACDRDGKFPFENISDFIASGLITLPSRTISTGLGGSLSEAQTIVGMLAQGDASSALIILNHYMIHATIADRSGWPEPMAARLEQENLCQPGLINAALAEPDLGSASYGGLPETVAVATRGDGWRISGRKAYVTGIPALTWLLVRARTDETTPRVGLFLVPAQAEGVSVHRNWNHSGMRGTHSHEVELCNVVVPTNNVITLVEGTEPHPVLTNMMRWNTGLLGALYDGIVRAGFYWTLNFLQTRVPSNLGRPLATLSSVQEAIGNVALALDENQMLLELYATHIAAGQIEDADREAAVIKTKVIDGAAELTLQLLSLAGNTGLNMGNPLERCHRDALCGRIHAPHSALIRRNAGQKSLAF
ncbi:acyl-CoA/acyl-ACP dehydrogenase [Gluconobacter cerinus]|uniref:acyl-CoA dehydrogenase family protein n=1 Tax=Gluconobacter TaxID=441 RepID=UPI001B8C083E|nr:MULTISPECIES: acyl-CoA dehydrogenase family protein [Gluconobacter]MBS1032572.1 acyl-CoA/acyl-ACP dehydrogenase [Gluconobacter cerinus]